MTLQEEGFLNPVLTSPLQLQVQSPGNSLTQLVARAVCTLDKEKVQPLLSLVEAKAAPPFISPAC